MIPTQPIFPTGDKESQCIKKELSASMLAVLEKKVNFLHFYSTIFGRGVNPQVSKAYLIHRWGEVTLKPKCIKKVTLVKIYTIICVIWFLLLNTTNSQGEGCSPYV